MGLFDRFRSKPPTDADPDTEVDVPAFRLADEPGGRAWLTLDLGALPTDSVVIGNGEEPNGAFWEGVASYVAPVLSSRVDFDSEGSMFAVEGDRTDLEQLRELLDPLVLNPSAMTTLMHRVQAEGVTLEGYGR